MSAKYTVVLDRNNDQILVYKFCSIKKERYLVTVPKADFDRWAAGAHAQDVFTYLDADQREFLISGFTPAEWKDTFGDS